MNPLEVTTDAMEVREGFFWITKRLEVDGFRNKLTNTR